MVKYYLSIGEVDAPVVVESYINLGCPYCANYFEAAYTTFEDYIKNGELKHVIKHDDRTNGRLLKGTVANAHLNYEKPEKSYKHMRELFKTQKTWTSSYDVLLTTLNRQLFLKEDQESGERSKHARADIESREVTKVPTVFINGAKFSFDSEDSIEGISDLLKREIKNRLTRTE
ncbi:thioredoxin domain-containing protein [Aliicoccus persicus]|uniref:Thioredoxin n=1 Tax=Aliicoccus persicus TaxID=930138 RepID=A0A662Z2I5_9STAP|nr:thioredoxin domain-containing protein [Aliicoccus persicus]SEV92108.1 Thioredoxin [Aliicoccus persicus]